MQSQREMEARRLGFAKYQCNASIIGNEKRCMVSVGMYEE